MAMLEPRRALGAVALAFLASGGDDSPPVVTDLALHLDLADLTAESSEVVPGDYDQRRELMAGWSPPNQDAEGAFATNEGPRSEIAWRLAWTRPLELVLTGRSMTAANEAPTRVAVSWNGELLAQPRCNRGRRDAGPPAGSAARRATDRRQHHPPRLLQRGRVLADAAGGRMESHPGRRRRCRRQAGGDRGRQLATALPNGARLLRHAARGRFSGAGRHRTLRSTGRLAERGACPRDSGFRPSLPGGAGRSQRDDHGRHASASVCDRTTSRSGSASSRWPVRDCQRPRPDSAFPGRSAVRPTRGRTPPQPPWKRPAAADSAAATSPAPEGDANRPGAKPPHVLIFLVDTLRADRLGCYGYERPTSPNIDRFAAGAVRFEHAVAQSSWTRPSTASILTGLYPHNHGARSRNHVLAHDVAYLPEVLRSTGYRALGVSSNSIAGPTFGFRRGFSQFKQLPEDLSSPGIHLPVWRVVNESAGVAGTDRSRRLVLRVHARDGSARALLPPGAAPVALRA